MNPIFNALYDPRLGNVINEIILMHRNFESSCDCILRREYDGVKMLVKIHVTWSGIALVVFLLVENDSDNELRITIPADEVFPSFKASVF